MNNNKKLIPFISLHNSCARYGNHLILLIKIGNGHKEKMLSHSIFNSFKKCEGVGIEIQSKLMVAAKLWLFSPLKK